ncbi:MFS maltose permease [Trichoderma barbatum]
MESFDMFLNRNLVALDAFGKQYGAYTTIFALVLMKATTFVSFFVSKPTNLLRCTATIRVAWSIGSIIVAAVATLGHTDRKNQWTWRVPFLPQTLLLVIIFIAPKSPCADLRRTTSACLTYASKIFAGNLILNKVTCFFEQSVCSCLHFVANMVSHFISGIRALIPQSHATSYAQAVLGITTSFVFAGTLGLISHTISSPVCLRALSTEVSTFVCCTMAYSFLPELKHRTYHESNILFN